MFRASRAILTCMLVIAMGHTNIVINVAGDEGNIPEWGFYVYMAGDNTLYDELTDDLNPIKSYYLGNKEEIEKAISSVKNQAKT